MYKPSTRYDFYEILKSKAETEVDCNGTERIEDTGCCIPCGRVYGEKQDYCISCGDELIPFSDINSIDA